MIKIFFVIACFYILKIEGADPLGLVFCNVDDGAFANETLAEKDGNKTDETTNPC